MAGLHDLLPAPGQRRPRKRVGRGIGSGRGKTSGRGQKGQLSRSGGKIRRGFEGGQMPLQRRIPKRGFSNEPFRKVIATVNVETLNRFADGTEVTPELLRQEGIVKGRADGIKILGRGELERSLTVRAHAFSEQAMQKIQAVGGRAEVI